MRSTYAVAQNKYSHFRKSFIPTELQGSSTTILAGASLLPVIHDGSADEPSAINIIELGNSREPHAVAVSPDGRRAYVTTLFSGTLEVIDTDTATVVASVHMGGYPTGLSVSPDGAQLYIGEGHGHVYAMDTATYAQRTIVESANYPGKDVAVTPDSRYVYVLDNVFNEILVIKAHTNAVTTTIALDQSPQSITIAPTSGFAYIGTDTASTETFGSITVIDTAIHAVIDVIAVDSGVRSVLVAPDEKHVYAITDTSTVAIDTATFNVVHSVPVSKSLESIAVTPDGRYAYIVNSASSSVSVLALDEPATEGLSHRSLGALFGLRAADQK